jgi:hypothetical protein
MKNPESRGTRIGIVFLLLFCIVLGLLLLVRGTVQETFVIPLLYLFWLGGLIFDSVPQAIFWGLLIVVVAILLIRSLTYRMAAGPAPDRGSRPEQANHRVARWAGLVRRTASGHSRDGFALNEFRKLIYSVWAYRANLSPDEIERQVASGALEVPPEFRFYIEDRGWADMPGRSVWERALRRLQALLGRDGSPSTESGDPQLSPMLESLERMSE